MIFSHRAIGFGFKENSLAAINAAVSKGFSVEIDLRIKDGKIVLTHDKGESEEGQSFEGVIRLMQNNPGILFALHLKENSGELFKKAAESVKQFGNCILFATDFNQDPFISTLWELIGKERLALYARGKDIDLKLLEKVDYLWLDETGGDIYKEMDYFTLLKKKVICCSPELFLPDYGLKLEEFKKAILEGSQAFGICTDFAQERLNHCPVCDSGGPFKEVDRTSDYVVLRCNNCHLEFSECMRYDAGYYEHMHYSDSPNLDSIKSLSKEEFVAKASLLAGDINWQPHNHVFKWMEANLKKGSTVLDIGCGVGWFMAALEGKGFKPVGIEVSTKIVEMLKRKGFSAYLGPFESLDVKLPSPDLVVLLGVIEHVTDPVGLLKDIRQKFPHSTLLISIPNPKRWDFALGIRNHWDYPPNHLTPVWTQASLEIAFKRSGYRIDDWFFPPVACDEIWFVCLDWLFFKLGLRKKGYFLSLTSESVESSGLFKSVIKLLYKELEKVNSISKYLSRPLLNAVSKKLNRKGYSGLSAYAVANP